MRLKSAAMAASTLLGAGLGAGAAAVVAGRYGAGAALKATPGRPAGFDGPAVTVRAVRDGRVALSRTALSELPLTYGLAGDGVHAVVGPVVRGGAGAAGGQVVRRLERVTYGRLEPGMRVRVTPQVHTGSPASALGIEHADVTVPSELGPLPAWLVRGARNTWAIAVHGLGATREQAMTVLPLLHRLGLTVFVPAYRGDPGAPAPEDGISRLGYAEWRDLDAALRYAEREGAGRVVLYGWSAGGAMALRAGAESELAGLVSGLVLDSPVLDWRAAVRGVAAGRRRLPGPLLRLAELAAEERAGLDSAGPLRGAGGAVGVPVLVVHGPDDSIAPFAASRAFAEAAPERVMVHEVRRAEHAAMWNAGPASYEEALRRFLVPLL